MLSSFEKTNKNTNTISNTRSNTRLNTKSNTNTNTKSNLIDYHSLAIKNDFDFILSKIKDDNSLINIVDNSQNTFLHYALINKNIQATINLANIPLINLNCKNNLGDTPLHIACYNVLNSLLNQDKNIYYHFEIVILLLNNGARKDILNNQFMFPFNFLKNINNLLDLDGNTLLHIVIKNRKINVAKFMIEYLNFGLNTKNNNGETPVHLSVFNAVKYFDTMEFYHFLNFLYKVGYNEYIKDSRGFTAGHYLENVFV
jgi:ankyrin repeat protein